MRGIFGLALILALAVNTVSAFSNKVFLIRHGEKPANHNVTGLSAQGEERAQCLRHVFGASSGYDIGYIIVEDYKSDGSRDRPYETVEPLAKDLGLTIDHHCSKDDTKCAKDSIKSYADNNNGNILVCWEHQELGKIGAALGGKFDYPSDHFNLIYEIYHKDLTSNSPYSENCPGLDN
ncbi:uncharacterized protein FA14DRAFT_180117 [Meira miltonrushii]|uniref:Phosphoglycerate mutase family protein n=1 Tax=Meira miltonrushii TaxID=1280837 RepID=A0A316VBW5_9BASI|nr:uncharacterized protein FA14DRAFT_180117 [Meira miltonrushii]PWN33471.1 hypothetical protein FA14DRAFT_180117 [Meira miltonrushii]